MELDPLAARLFTLYAEGRRIALKVAGGFGLTPGQLGVLKLIEQGGALGQKEIGEGLRMGASTVTGIIDRMERDGRLVRTRDEDDRRVTRVELTRRGARLAARISFDPMRMLGEAVARLTKAERRDLERLLEKLALNLAAAVSEQLESRRRRKGESG